MLDDIKKFLRRNLNRIIYRRYIDNDYANPTSNNKLVLVTHEMTRTGAPMLLLYVAKALFSLGWDLVVISRTTGPLIKDFSRYSKVIISYDVGKLQNRIVDLRENGFNQVFINSVISGIWIPHFKLANYRVVSLVHELPSVIKAWKAEECLRIVADDSDEIVFPSDFVKSSLEKLGVKFHNYHIKPQGIFLNEANEPKDENAYDEIIETYKLEKKKIILNVATGNYRKGFDIFCNAAEAIPEYNFIWIGDIDTSLLKNHPDNLITPGYVRDVTILTKFYRAASLFFISSREEPFGSVILESLYNGTPIIGFRNVGGYEDIINEYGLGVLVELGNIDDLKKAIETLIIDGRYLEELSMKSHRVIVENYSFERYIDYLVNI